MRKLENLVREGHPGFAFAGTLVLGAMTWSSGAASGAAIVSNESLASPADNSFSIVPDASSTDYLEGAPGTAAGASTGTNGNGAYLSASAPSQGGSGGSLSDLTDGLITDSETSGVPKYDDPAHRYFVDGNGSTPGSNEYTITIDLGSPVSIEQFNTYSAHYGPRVGQYYTLIGSNSPVFATYTTIATVTVPSAGQEMGVSIHDDSQMGTSPNGTPLGDFQYLQMQIKGSDGPVNDPNNDGEGTFYAEIDVVVAPTPEPTSLSLIALGTFGLLARRRRKA
jgi:hypothetical protein